MDGLVMPDVVIADAVQDALGRFLQDEAALDFLLAGRPQADRDMMRTALQVRPIEVRLGQSQKPIEAESIVVLMPPDAPDRPTLGDQHGDTFELTLGVTTLTADIGLGSGITLPLAALPPNLPARGMVRLGDPDLGQETETAVYALDGMGGATLAYRGRPSPQDILPHGAGDAVIFYTHGALIGAENAATVRIDVLSDNALLVSYLSHMLRAYLQAQGEAFDTQGITLQLISMTDLAPRLMAYPAHFYTRTLLVPVRYVAGLPVSRDAVTDTQVLLTPTGVTPTSPTVGLFS